MTPPLLAGVRGPTTPTARLTVVEQVYHETDGQPAPHGHQFSRQLTTDEQTYSRTLKVGGTWQALDRGWVEVPALLLLVNTEGERRQVQPTDGERAEAAGRVVEVAFGCASDADLRPALLVRPGESCRFEPADAATVCLRCRGEGARCVLTLVPA